MSDCIFCAIVDGEAPSHRVYEDDHTLAFLDANPLAEGHTLVVPKAHHERLGDLPEDLAAAVGETVARVTPAVGAGVGAAGTTVAYNNGRAAGQEVPHVHAHVVPRFEGDGAGPVHALFSGRAGHGDPEAVAEDIAAELAEA